MCQHELRSPPQLSTKNIMQSQHRPERIHTPETVEFIVQMSIAEIQSGILLTDICRGLK